MSMGVGGTGPVPATGLAPDTYANAFVRGTPRESVQRVQNRLHKAKILADELADYFAARRELEGNYLKSLQKIAKRSFLSDPSALGPNFLPIYERLVAEIGELASIHGELEKRLETECEAPMRSASSTGEWGRIKEHDDSLSSTLKEIATLEGQLAKDQKKVEGASSKKASQAVQKAAETERTLKQTLELWETEAPFAFEAYQRVDTERLNLMKEVVTKFETARSDAAQRLMSSTEQSMQVVLNFDPQSDMQEFALKSGNARGGSTNRPSAAAAAATTTSGSDLNRRGTFLGRNTTSTAATNQSPASGRTNGVNEFGGRAQSSSASIHSTDRGAAPPSISEQGTPSRSTGGSTLKNALSRFGRGRSNRNANDMQTVYGSLPEGPEATSSMQPPSIMRTPSNRGDGRRSMDSRSDMGAPGTGTGSGAGVAVPGSLMAPLTPNRLGSGNTSSVFNTPAPRVDAEGFSIPPPDRKPWETADVSASPGILDENRDMFGDVAAPKMTGMSIAQKPISEDLEQDQAALERVRSTLLTARSPNVGPQRRNTARRERRDVRNTTYNTATNLDEGSTSTGGARTSMFGLPHAASPIASPTSAFKGVPGTGPERTQSLLSSSSMSQIAQDPASIPSGLNASITERVNVVFTGREISRIMVVGEITVTAKDLALTGPARLRLEAFEQLEKAAPNPAFLQAGEGAGEYRLDVGAIASQGGKATLLKYQVHISPHRWKEYAPLTISSQWRCEDAQTSILINFSANTTSKCSLSSPTSSLQDLAISVDVTSPTVNNIMSKPAATYSAEQKKLFWTIPDSFMIGSEETSKALARFQVDQKSEIRPIEVRWRLPGLTLSNLGLSIVDGQDGLSFQQISRQTVSGRYFASP